MPYLNRALAEEQLGVDEDQQNQHQAAQGQYSGAVKVGLSTDHVSFRWQVGGGGGGGGRVYGGREGCQTLVVSLLPCFVFR